MISSQFKAASFKCYSKMIQNDGDERGGERGGWPWFFSGVLLHKGWGIKSVIGGRVINLPKIKSNN
jgi:hypothetical protein